MLYRRDFNTHIVVPRLLDCLLVLGERHRLEGRIRCATGGHHTQHGKLNRSKAAHDPQRFIVSHLNLGFDRTPETLGHVRRFQGKIKTQFVGRGTQDLRTVAGTLEERLHEERIVFLWGEINPASAGGLIMRLLELQAKSRERDVNLYINSPGGSVDDTLAIYDTMQFMTCDVATYCVGQAASGAAMVLAAGAKGKRFALPHSKIMIHQPWGGVSGQAADIAIQAEEILKAKKLLNELMAKHTGRSVEMIEQETERDRYLSPAEAKEYGIVDEIVQFARETEKK